MYRLLFLIILFSVNSHARSLDCTFSVGSQVLELFQIKDDPYAPDHLAQVYQLTHPSGVKVKVNHHEYQEKTNLIIEIKQLGLKTNALFTQDEKMQLILNIHEQQYTLNCV